VLLRRQEPRVQDMFAESGFLPTLEHMLFARIF